jgi:hypothetical protein
MTNHSDKTKTSIIDFTVRIGDVINRIPFHAKESLNFGEVVEEVCGMYELFIETSTLATPQGSIVDQTDYSKTVQYITNNFGKSFEIICMAQVGKPEMKRDKDLLLIQKKKKDNMNKTQKLEKLNSLFKMSSSIDIKDVMKMIGMTRGKLLDFFRDNSDSLTGIQIDGDFINISSSTDVNRFIDLLDQQFSDWGSKESLKYGKIE